MAGWRRSAITPREDLPSSGASHLRAVCRSREYRRDRPVVNIAEVDCAAGELSAAEADRAAGELSAVEADQAAAAGEDTEDLDELLAELDEEIGRAGMRGNVALDRGKRRQRPTRRRQDAPPLPGRKVDPRTVGKTYTTPDGKTFRPSLFLTLTCPSYGRVTAEGAPVDPDRYDYTAAARDALHFAALFDRFIQDLRPLLRL